jgi:hypothetical protein
LVRWPQRPTDYRLPNKSRIARQKNFPRSSSAGRRNAEIDAAFGAGEAAKEEGFMAAKERKDHKEKSGRGAFVFTEDREVNEGGDGGPSDARQLGMQRRGHPEPRLNP